MLHDGSKTVRAANKLSVKDLDKRLSTSSELSTLHVYSTSRPTKVLDEDKRVMFSMLEDNMKHLYVDSSMGWDASEKRDELFNEHSRFVLARERVDNALSGYCSFRFEHEDEWDILYCYEVQVPPTCRRQGIGRTLMLHLISIGKRCKMQKINLTVFKANHGATTMYKNMGFTLDETSPDEEDEADYEILCFSLG